MTEPGIHEKMGPNDDYEKVENPLARAAFGADYRFDMNDPAQRRAALAEIRRVEGEQPSPHALAGSVHGERLNNAISLLREAEAELRTILQDPQARGIPRDGLMLAATEISRNVPRLQRAYSG